ncbi:23S rRNA (adenine(1618)-N(6))-methyltransferase RlmF [Pseudomarimonas salicorniae]|uniref:Ribosomal RNA large subunit methyltransferase F n=1 Tax=Pseudomarimonas salicorniae TaxID=2933270 RepID=A0ABT0GEM0_9GAMM|nr:23S rRNA (adenine(1618)-N(6))-methyltransferase RlmF [Lysobacter sp. CAU 1642]MCK7592998.1 23S rRNA (adenine(1618)-N(6))-methyltransferase RlmF [Lysobacter sp. CAU 1642]
MSRKAPLRGAKGGGPAAPLGLHPRNRHQGSYDFDALLRVEPGLARHLVTTPRGERSIDFARPESVRALNAALLHQQYGVRRWELPDGYLCPPVPGRADYVHCLADLLAADLGGAPPQGSAVRVLDIGVGANLVYPLIGHAEYGWHFVGSDIDNSALEIARRTLGHNPGFAAAIELRHQSQRNSMFKGVLAEGERFAASLCNPPFHASAAEAAEGSRRKWRNLGRVSEVRGKRPALNFGGQSNELWCSGGEAGFLRRMIEESAQIPECIGWFTSLVAKAEHLAALRARLERSAVREVREIPMAQGAKRSRLLAWSFLDAGQRAALCGAPRGDA